MMPPPVRLAGRLQKLLASFHRGVLDVPDGLIARDCVFRLNGADYESTLGRPRTDPLVRLLGHGPAAYRSLAQRLRHLLPGGHVALDELQGDDRGGLVTAVATVKGTPHMGGTACAFRVDVALLVDADGRITEVGLQVGEDALRALTDEPGA
jgi:hypothetical protein